MSYLSKPDRCHIETMSVFLTNDQMPATIFYSSVTFALLMSIAVVVGLIGNTLSYLVFKKPTMKSSVTTLIIGMTVNDQLILILSVLVFVAQLISPLVNNAGLELYIVYAAVTVYPLVHVVKTTSVWILVAITCERYIVVRYPLLARSYCTRSKAKKVLAIVAVLSLLYNVVRFWEFKLVESCKQKADVVSLLRQNMMYIKVYVVWLNLVTQFLIPFVLLIGLNSQTVKIIRASGMWKSRRGNNATTVSVNAFDRRNAQISLMMVVIVIVFLITNLLPLFMNVLDALNPSMMLVDIANDTATGTEKIADPQGLTIYYFLVDLCNLMVVANAAIPVFVYLTFCRRFRALLFDLLKCRPAKTDSGSSEAEIMLPPSQKGFTRRYTWSCNVETMENFGTERKAADTSLPEEL